MGARGRRACAAALVVSLLVSIAALTARVASFRVKTHVWQESDRITAENYSTCQWTLILAQGAIQIRREASQFPPAAPYRRSSGWRVDCSDFPNYPIEYWRSELQHAPFVAGFQVAIGNWTWTDKSAWRQSHQLRSVTVPLWCPGIVFAIAPAIAVVRCLRTRRHFAAGLCATCGYDLRATPERCPECGMPATEQTVCETMLKSSSNKLISMPLLVALAGGAYGSRDRIAAHPREYPGDQRRFVMASQVAESFVRQQGGEGYRVHQTAITPEGGWEFYFVDEIFDGPRNTFTVGVSQDGRVISHVGGL